MGQVRGRWKFLGKRIRHKSCASNFIYQSDWPVLVIEDTEDRISWFGQRMPTSAIAAAIGFSPATGLGEVGLGV